MTVFVLTFFTFMLLILFAALFNFSTVFVDYGRAGNIAQQASLAATREVYAAIEEAMDQYDLAQWAKEVPNPVEPKVNAMEKILRASHPDWADSEVRFAAMDEVLSSELPGNAELLVFVEAKLIAARGDIRNTVATILEENGAVLSGSEVILVNERERIEVRTSVRYQSDTFGFPFLKAYAEQVHQEGESRRIGFAGDIGWYGYTITY